MSSFILFCEAQSDWCDIRYALVTLSREHIMWILGRMSHAKQMKAANGNFYCLEYFDSCTAAWYKDITEAEELTEWQEVFERPTTPPQRTDLDTIIITDDTCHWTSHPKHADDIAVRTPQLTIENLRNLL
jgi:hypothetical protein